MSRTKDSNDPAAHDPRPSGRGMGADAAETSDSRRPRNLKWRNMDGKGSHSVWLTPAELSAMAPSFRGLLKLHFFDSPSGVRQFLDHLISSDAGHPDSSLKPDAGLSAEDLLATVGPPALLADEHGVVRRANVAFEHWLDLKPGQAQGKHLWGTGAAPWAARSRPPRPGKWP